MSSDFKLDVVICHEGNEPELGSLNGKVSFGDGFSAAYKILGGLHGQGKRLISNIVTNAGCKAANDRSLRGNRVPFADSIKFLTGGDDKRDHGTRRTYGPLVSGIAYCISSCSMILLNKVVLSSYGFNAGVSLMFYQNFICSVVVLLLGFSGAVSVEKLNWKLIMVWLPINIIFIGMLVSGMYSLKYINIAMVTILKNVTNILTAIGELYIFRKHQNQKVWTAMFLMLTLRQVMDKAQQFTGSGSLNEISMVLLNNLLSLPLAIILIFLFDEWEYVKNTDVIKMPEFWLVSTASGFLGLAISFTSMWFLHQTGPTTYSLVGSLNKIPISIAGLVMFNVPLSLPNFFSILFGLFAGVFFAWAKMS
ncbi:GDP-mannose transporter GONST2 isoform X2 [Malania oleifera]|uniref:GDP-mannose transporter GONST2 isoform X2 n=1 Tax=Malania oleifera TaxID=397392 RepID=UPI0025ADED20|nr:GDP-mannose transporter GONST2 isoform X2 [Malania oleifera]